MFLPDENVLFIHIPKTGGQSVSQALLPRKFRQEMRSARHLLGDANKTNKGVPIYSAHMTYEEYIRYYPNLTSSRKFTIVRNPIDRLISEWRWRWSKEMPWDTFCTEENILNIKDDYDNGRDDRRHILPQTLFTEGADDIHIIRTEALDKEFPDLCKQWGIKHIKLTRKNVSRKSQPMLNPRHREVIQKIYAKDFEAYYPELLEADH